MSDGVPPTTEQTRPQADLPYRVVKTAYLRLLLVGLFGVHRFYVGKPVSAIVIAVLALLTFELFPIWALLVLYLIVLAADGLFLSKWVAQRNEKLVEEFEAHPERFFIPDDETTAPWARGRKKGEDTSLPGGFFGNIWFVLRLPFRAYGPSIRTVLFFWVIPGLTGVAAAEFRSLELLIIPMAILAAIGLIGSLDQTLSRYPTILEIPGVGPALERVAAMREYYWNNEPKIGAAFKGLFMQATGKYKPYWSLASIVVATVIIEGVISYEDNLNYIPLLSAARIVGITALLAALAVLLNLIPLTALSFHYSLSGKTTRLRLMTVGAMIATVMGYSLANYRERQDGSGSLPSFLSASRLEERMESPDFRDDLVEKLEFFLNYYIDSDEPETEMANVLADLLSSQTPNDESEAFGVIKREYWAAVVYHHSDGLCYTRGSDGSVVTMDSFYESQWDDAADLENLQTAEFVDADTAVTEVQIADVQMTDRQEAGDALQTQDRAMNAEDSNPPDAYGSGDEVELALDADTAPVDSYQYSILAIVYRPSLEEEEAEVQQLIDAGEMSPMQIIKYMDQELVAYRWADLAVDFDAIIPEECRTLICDAPRNCPKFDASLVYDNSPDS